MTGGFGDEFLGVVSRLCAEDPERDFLPATGLLRHLKFPAQGRAVRVDTGVQAGDAVTIHYDPLLAKLIVHGKDRAAALHQLGLALRDTQLVGVRTNRDFLANLAVHPSLVAGAVDTGFIASHRAELVGPAVAGVAAIAAAAADPSPDPWANRDGWRLNGPAEHRVATDRLLVSGMHLHFPAYYHLVRDGGAYRLVAEAWQHGL